MNTASQFLRPTSRYRDAAEKLLADGKPGDSLTIDQLREAMDAATLPHNRIVHHVYAARRKLERLSKCWWTWDKEHGVLHCLTEQQAKDAIGGETKRLGRRAKRALQRASCVDVSKLDDTQRRQFDLSVSQIALAKSATSAAMHKSLERNKTGLALPKIEELSSLFK